MIMMRSLFLFFTLFFVTSTAMAIDFPNIHFFEPVDKDLSLWYLANIFGPDLVASHGEIRSPYTQLLAVLFGVFNQVVLVLGIIIVIYGVVGGTLVTASEGKPLGEKWHAMWLPIRIVAGIGLLVPKAGSGYCLAQGIIMWLVIQGIGAGDAIWSEMIKYFEEGGAIIVTQKQTPESALTYDNMNYTYSLQSDIDIGGSPYGAAGKEKAGILKSMVCVEAFNQDASAVENAGGKMRQPYTVLGEKVGNVYYYALMFGDRSKYDPSAPLNSAQKGAECGYIQYQSAAGSSASSQEIQKDNQRAAIYIMGLYNMAKSLNGLARSIVSTSAPDDSHNFPRYYDQVRHVTELFMYYIISYDNILNTQEQDTRNNSLKLYSQYGWILAGNYYTVLSNFQAKATLMSEIFVKPGKSFIRKDALDASTIPAPEVYTRAHHFYSDAYLGGDPESLYSIPNSEYMHDQNPNATVKSPVNRSKVEKLQKDVSEQFGDAKLSGETKDRVNEFMEYLTGKGSSGLTSQNPINNAAKYGKMLTEAAVGMMIAFGVTWMGLTLMSSVWTAKFPIAYPIFQFFSDLLTPMMLALGSFMYAQGAVLGVFIPLIPYVVFLTGVTGWFLQVVEAVAAAPIIPIGLIFPETKDEIWGRAAPAYMLILSLFLRPGLMIIGFAAAMIVMWIMTEILNIGFLTLVAGTFRIEDMFGFVSILTVYVTVFTYIVTESYSLINVVPDRVLSWLGDRSMGVKGAKEALGAAKQATESGAGAVAGGLEFGTKFDMYRAKAAVDKHEEEKLKEELAEAGNAADPEKAKEELLKDPRKKAVYDRMTGGGEADTPDYVKSRGGKPV